MKRGRVARVAYPRAVGDLSANFSRAEFRCSHCGVSLVDPRLVTVLQRARTRIGRPLTVVSGYRCAVQNRRVGGIPASQHKQGRAADVPGDYGSVALWKACGAIGIGVRNGRVIHVDVTPGRRAFVFDD